MARRARSPCVLTRFDDRRPWPRCSARTAATAAERGDRRREEDRSRRSRARPSPGRPLADGEAGGEVDGDDLLPRLVLHARGRLLGPGRRVRDDTSSLPAASSASPHGPRRTPRSRASSAWMAVPSRPELAELGRDALQPVGEVVDEVDARRALAAKRSAVARPMPLPPPVIRTTLPRCRSLSIRFLPVLRLSRRASLPLRRALRTCRRRAAFRRSRTVPRRRRRPSSRSGCRRSRSRPRRCGLPAVRRFSSRPSSTNGSPGSATMATSPIRDDLHLRLELVDGRSAARGSCSRKLMKSRNSPSCSGCLSGRRAGARAPEIAPSRDGKGALGCLQRSPARVRPSRSASANPPQ